MKATRQDEMTPYNEIADICKCGSNDKVNRICNPVKGWYFKSCPKGTQKFYCNTCAKDHRQHQQETWIPGENKRILAVYGEVQHKISNLNENVRALMGAYGPLIEILDKAVTNKQKTLQAVFIEIQQLQQDQETFYRQKIQERSIICALHKHAEEIDQFYIKLKNATAKYADYIKNAASILWMHYGNIILSVDSSPILKLQDEKQIQMFLRIKEQKIAHFIEEMTTGERPKTLDILEDEQRLIQEINQTVLVKLNSLSGAFTTKRTHEASFIRSQIDIVSRDLMLREMWQEMQSIKQNQNIRSSQDPQQQMH
ncbi:hypothetical protein FGO68_gene12522 [Halteria grandinella]|uniref:Uncharacterized protein n=1 Tax=Halteria grandinella TaxID=5974 RepID=A0A8J8NN69_HALGN|nr:hypothetical protein FGO68_gene12522 [Halteria grandinella]